MSQSIIESYSRKKEIHQENFKQLANKHRIISSIRVFIVLLFLFFTYQYISNSNDIMLIGMIISFIGFFLLIKKHQQIGRLRDLEKALIEINEQEISYLQNKSLPFENGLEFTNVEHAYSSDLDIFGPRSLFQNLNRTATHIGKITLADDLISHKEIYHIEENQDAIKELSPHLEWRQSFTAHAKLMNDKKETYDKLINWLQYNKTKIPKVYDFLAYLLPVLIISAILLYFFTDIPIMGNIILVLYLANLSTIHLVQKNNSKEIINVHKIGEILKDYSILLRKIEEHPFQSERLKSLQNQLRNQEVIVSQEIQKLSVIFSRVENIQHLIGGIILNGLFLYHIHTLNKIVRWKQKNAADVPSWLSVIGEIESLLSFSNFAYNNPSYCFPELNEDYKLDFEELGHPLIDENKRIDNDVSFSQEQFIILTGSNMSGKSTFLRSLGINMVLAGAGSVICAKHADIHPLRILVSMRQSDSLADSESYFFAEVKRLKFIMDQLNDEICFVLLDEILRGTNSDDKRSGAIGVLEKIIKNYTYGVIATHDLELCLMTENHPEMLANKCFEVEIVDNELVFDYKLRPGVCKNKSATFLMKKMGIIGLGEGTNGTLMTQI